MQFLNTFRVKFLSKLVLVVALILPASPVQAANDTVAKTVCKLAVGYETVDTLQADLLIEAKREVINELFGELIVASTAVENFVVTSDQIRASSIGFVRVDGSADFRNGESFAEVCVEISAYVTEDDKEKFEPIKLTKKLCDSDNDMTTTQLISYVKDEAIIQALLEFNPKLKGAEKESLLQLVQKVTYRGNGFITDTQTYCANFEGYVVPVELMAFLETDLAASTDIEGLIAHYSFDDGTAKDASGNRHDGVVYGSPIEVAGISGKALNFDGIKDYVEVADFAGLNSPQLSIIAWIKLSDLPTTAPYIVVNKERQYEIGIVDKPYDEAMRHEFSVAFNSYWYWYGSGIYLKVDEFIQVAVVFEKNNTLAIYVNGELVKNVSYASGLKGTNNCLRIATRGCSNEEQFKTFQFFKGVIDDVRIYNRSLTALEVQALYGGMK